MHIYTNTLREYMCAARALSNKQTKKQAGLMRSAKPHHRRRRRQQHPIRHKNIIYSRRCYANGNYLLLIRRAHRTNMRHIEFINNIRGGAHIPRESRGSVTSALLSMCQCQLRWCRASISALLFLAAATAEAAAAARE